MKFGKEFASQMVPEWQAAYMDYEFLKSMLKQIQVFKPRPAHRAASSAVDVESQVINVRRSETMVVHRRTSSWPPSHVYRGFSGLTHSNSHRAANAADVESQMINVPSETMLADDDVASPVIIAHNVRHEGGHERSETMFLKVVEDGGNYEMSFFKGLDAEMNKVLDFYKARVGEVMTEAASLNRHMQRLVATRVEVNNPSGRRGHPISLDNLKKDEAILQKAFVEFYHKLNLVKSYSSLNTTAFSKIMKKYDKIASRNASKDYITMVHNSYLGTSDEVNKLMKKTEATFIEHFSNSNRKKGMNVLRPKKKKETHIITFSTGFMFGCTIALMIALLILVLARHILDKEGRLVYMETMFPLYSLFGFIFLHMLMYAGNVYLWRKYRVNYAFVLGFKRGTELGYREVLLLSFSLSVLVLASVLASLDMEMYGTHSIKEFLPPGLVVLLIFIMILPCNVIYRSSRCFLLARLFRCAFSPFYKVTLSDSFFADQITSQVQSLRSLEFYICYYGWRDYRTREINCKSNNIFKIISIIIAAIPYMWRLLQCLRRWYVERDAMHGYNALKFLSVIMAVCARTAHSHRRGSVTWKVIAIILSFIATIVSMYWDIVLDWGLLQRRSRNRWLRDKLLIPHKSVYYVAIVLNVLLRIVWMQTVILSGLTFNLHRLTVTTITASLEIIRRGISNFFRIENDHLKNVEKYHASRSVPLPLDHEEDNEANNE